MANLVAIGAVLGSLTKMALDNSIIRWAVAMTATAQSNEDDNLKQNDDEHSDSRNERSRFSITSKAGR
jgi:hypothetical protein